VADAPCALHRYDLLDAQLDAGKSNGAAEKADGDARGERKHRSSHKSHRYKDDDKDRDRKSHRSSRHRTREEDDDRRWAVVLLRDNFPPGHVTCGPAQGYFVYVAGLVIDIAGPVIATV
jgi:hypothetical protein